jgi:orotate phosphoribosyltransferase
MEKEQVLQEFKDAGAILTGHFILSSGLHSSTYLQCARVLLDAKRAERLCKTLTDEVRNWVKTSGQVIDVIVAPAMGGVVVGYEMGRQLDVLSMFCERMDGSFALRRGFTLEPGQKVLIVEDVVTTGKSSMEAVTCIKEHGAIPVAVASLIDRRSQNDVSLTLPLISLMSLDIPTFSAENVPDNLKSTPAIKPGSRFLSQKAV